MVNVKRGIWVMYHDKFYIVLNNCDGVAILRELNISDNGDFFISRNEIKLPISDFDTNRVRVMEY